MQTREGYYYLDSLGGGFDRPPIVLIHGAGASHLSWPSGIRRVSGFRVLSIDLPGHGRSEGSACGSVRGYAEALNCYLGAASIYRAILVGVDLGGLVALQFALEHPDQCGGLGLIACCDHFSFPQGVLDMFSNPATFSLAVKMLHSRWFRENLPDRMFEDLKSKVFNCRRGTLIADFHAISGYKFPREKWTGLHIPGWICAAREDRISQPGTTRLLAASNPDIFLTWIQKAGHGLLLEQPEQVQSGLLEFLKIQEGIRI